MTDLIPAAVLHQLVLLHGDLNPQQAHVYARLAAAGDRGSWQLRGKIEGPMNCLTRTLPATVTFRNLGPGADLLARAIVPDPCFWAPGYPYLYDVHIELVVENKVVATAARTFGMRMLGVHEDRIYSESRPWKLLGAKDTSVAENDSAAWREAALTRHMTTPSDQQCDLASRQGVMLIADIENVVSADTERLERELTRLSRHAAVAIATVPEVALVTQQIRSTVPNLLVAQRCSASRPIAPADWADLVVYEVEDLETLGKQLRECRLPVLVQHVAGAVTSMEGISDRCRRLAATLDPIPCVAGCLV